MELPEKGRYLSTFHSGQLEKIYQKLKKNIHSCKLCPRNCCVNRKEARGICMQSEKARLTNAVVHTGEEPPLIQGSGAGAVFFSGCSMKCCYCQNFAFSQKNNGKDYTSCELGEIFLGLQKKGCSNLDLVTPAPHLPSIVEALLYAIPKGLTIPIVYNTSSYENLEIIQLLEGIVDIYLADIRYTNNEMGLRYSGVKDYWTQAQRSIREMYRQKGSRGLIIRHLVLPDGVSGTQEAMAFISEELSPSVHISLMSQYFPVHKAKEFSDINRKITEREYSQAVDFLEEYGLFNGWTQDFT
ncbi:MAG: 4Fe-4S cluster-binding domain-containing protein [Thermotogota bacterium]|nr:4Fe-4S cluster-binding domain-containing protein [Thermotogota bacterium]